MLDVRPAELRGSWYPASPRLCDEFLERMLASADDSKSDSKPDSKPESKPQAKSGSTSHRVGAIVPHAGWVYSGGVAFRALRQVAPESRASEPESGPQIIFIFGGHLGPRDPVRLLIEGGWETPYGPVLIHQAVAEDLSMAVEGDPETPDHYYEDNAIEVLMPMIKKLWPEIRVVTVGVPPTSIATSIGAEAIDRARARGIERIVVIGSTDLTHYGPNYRFSPHGTGRRGLDWVKGTNDPAIIDRIERLEAHQIVREAERARNACCPGAVAATLAAAKKLGAAAGRLLEYTTSHDVRPSSAEPSSFVGYAGIVLETPSSS